jgi:hypothetical protein
MLSLLLEFHSLTEKTTAQPRSRLGHPKNHKKKQRLSLKRSWAIGKLIRKTRAPASNKAVASQKPEEKKNAPATNKTGAMQKPKENPTLQSTCGLIHRANQQTTDPPASNKAGASQKPKEQPTPQPQTRLGHCRNHKKNLRFNPHPDWSIVKTDSKKSNAPASNKAGASQKPEEKPTPRPQTRLSHWKTHKKNKRPSLKQGWSIAKTRRKSNAPATNKTGALQKTPEKPTLQSTSGLKHRKNQQTTDAPASDKAGASQKPKEKKRPSHKQDWGMAKTKREIYASVHTRTEAS